MGFSPISHEPVIVVDITRLPKHQSFHAFTRNRGRPLSYLDQSVLFLAHTCVRAKSACASCGSAGEGATTLFGLRSTLYLEGLAALEALFSPSYSPCKKGFSESRQKPCGALLATLTSKQLWFGCVFFCFFLVRT